MTKGWAGGCEEKALGWGHHCHSASTCLLCQLLECVKVPQGTKTSSQDGPELGGDSGVEVGDRVQHLRGWTRDESKSKLTPVAGGRADSGTDRLTWGGGQRSSLGVRGL